MAELDDRFFEYLNYRISGYRSTSDGIIYGARLSPGHPAAGGWIAEQWNGAEWINFTGVIHNDPEEAQESIDEETGQAQADTTAVSAHTRRAPAPLRHAQKE